MPVACTAPLGHSTRRAYRLVEQSATCGSCPTATNVATIFKPPLCKWEKICKQIGTACRDGGIVLLCFATSTIPQSLRDSSLYTREPPLRRDLCKAKAFWRGCLKLIFWKSPLWQFNKKHLRTVIGKQVFLYRSSIKWKRFPNLRQPLSFNK